MSCTTTNKPPARAEGARRARWTTDPDGNLCRCLSGAEVRERLRGFRKVRSPASQRKTRAQARAAALGRARQPRPKPVATPTRTASAATSDSGSSAGSSSSGDEGGSSDDDGSSSRVGDEPTLVAFPSATLTADGEVLS